MENQAFAGESGDCGFSRNKSFFMDLNYKLIVQLPVVCMQSMVVIFVQYYAGFYLKQFSPNNNYYSNNNNNNNSNNNKYDNDNVNDDDNNNSH